jgi:K(+)-stimulated pyrophosphate-energized sodium pump
MFSFVERKTLKLAMIMATILVMLSGAAPAFASEAELVLPDLTSVSFFGMTGWTILFLGIFVCLAGAVFGMVFYKQLRDMPVHSSMREISELIYETCKTYLQTQGKFIMLLWAFIATIIVVYFGWLRHFRPRSASCSSSPSAWSASPAATAWPGSASGSTPSPTPARPSPRCKGKPFPTYAIPLKAGISIGTLLISVELVIMLAILLFVPGDYAGPCFIGFAIGESLGAAALRIAGGIFTKIADIGSDLMKIVFNIKEDDARNPGVIADCTGDNAGDSVGPTADGFETYGVTGVALITFILLAVADPTVQVQLLVWIFVMRILMIGTSVASYFINEAFAKASTRRPTR